MGVKDRRTAHFLCGKSSCQTDRTLCFLVKGHPGPLGPLSQLLSFQASSAQLSEPACRRCRSQESSYGLQIPTKVST